MRDGLHLFGILSELTVADSTETRNRVGLADLSEAARAALKDGINRDIAPEDLTVSVIRWRRGEARHEVVIAGYADGDAKFSAAYAVHDGKLAFVFEG